MPISIANISLISISIFALITTSVIYLAHLNSIDIEIFSIIMLDHEPIIIFSYSISSHIAVALSYIVSISFIVLMLMLPFIIILIAALDY